MKKVIKKLKSKKVILKTMNVVILLLVIVFNVGIVYGASDPTLVNKVNTALKKIQGYLVKIALPAAGVAIASGVLIRKFSFGNEEKMVLGKKVIVNAILGYAIIISIDLILKFVDSVI